MHDARTLWDLLAGRTGRRAHRKPPKADTSTRRSPMRDRYDDLTRTMLRVHGVRVRKWRTSMTGVAWEVHDRDGRISRLIEAPRPRGPMSCAVFLHEIGHHAIGFHRYKPRCLEEYHAWRFALDQMHRHGISVTPRVEKRMAESLAYALDKAIRRGLRRIPSELEPFAPLSREYQRLRSSKHHPPRRPAGDGSGRDG